MRIHRQNRLPGSSAGQEDRTADTPGRRLRWRPRRRGRQNSRHAPWSGSAGDQTAPVQAAPGSGTADDHAARVGAAPGEAVAAAMQLAIALLTAGLDSPELEAWAADTLTPVDADGLGDFMAGLHVVSVLLLNELQDATGEPSAAVLQRLAIMAERRRGTSSSG
jgi:hypothetical protein